MKLQDCPYCSPHPCVGIHDVDDELRLLEQNPPTMPAEETEPSIGPHLFTAKAREMFESMAGMFPVMTALDWFAAFSLAGYLAHPTAATRMTPEQLGAYCYRFALGCIVEKGKQEAKAASHG